MSNNYSFLFSPLSQNTNYCSVFARYVFVVYSQSELIIKRFSPLTCVYSSWVYLKCLWSKKKFAWRTRLLIVFLPPPQPTLSTTLPSLQQFCTLHRFCSLCIKHGVSKLSEQTQFKSTQLFISHCFQHWLKQLFFTTHLEPFTIKKHKRKSPSERVCAQRPKERQLSSWLRSC